MYKSYLYFKKKEMDVEFCISENIKEVNKILNYIL